jgi:hypothetical protein
MTCLRLPAIALLALAWALPAVSDPAGQWGDFESVRLHVTQAGSPALDSYLQSSHSNQDFQLDFADPQQPEHGVIMMVAGRVMLVRGLKLTAGSELAALDQPLLMYGLVSKTLGRVLPAGPDAVGAGQRISHVDTAVGLAFSTPSAQGNLPPPWSVEGSVRPAADHSLDFDLVLKSAARTVINLKGNLRHQSDFRLDDSMELDGFSIFSLEYRAGYVAKPMTDHPKTIGELRRQIDSITPAVPSSARHEKVSRSIP